MKAIMLFGDSDTYGSFDPEGLGWAGRLRSFIETHYEEEIAVYNLGIPGNTTIDILKRFEREFTARKAEKNIVIFAIGVNDARYVNGKPVSKIQEVKKTIQKIITLSRKHAQNIIFIGLTKIDEAKTRPTIWSAEEEFINKQIVLFNKEIKKICDKNKTPFIPVMDIIGKKDLYDDGVHPTNKGHEKLFQHIKKNLIALKIL